MQLGVCFLASSLLACLSHLYERSSEMNHLLRVTYLINVHKRSMFMIETAVAKG